MHYELCIILERQTYCEVEGKVTAQSWMDDGEMLLLIFIGGIDGLHTHVETHNEVIEVQAQTQSIADCYLFPESIKMELSARLVLVVADSPDITGIHEQGSAEFPEQAGTILYVHIKLHIARLVDEVNAPVMTDKTSRT